MPIRITGMNSGLDTESIIQDLAAARRKKVNTIKTEQTKKNWIQDAWKDINTKISKFYSSLDNLKFSSSYNAKKTTVSQSGVANITTSNDAPVGAYSLNISQLASYASLTSEKIDATSATTLSQLGIEEPGSFDVKFSDGTVKTVQYDKDTTMAQMRSKLAETGLQVNFDTVNQRFFLNSKTSGANSNFELTNDSQGVLDVLKLSNGKYNEGKNLQLSLNGIDYETESNVIEINGLTISAQKVTDGDVTITTEKDTSEIYSKIKNFISQYNELVKEIDKLYNADSAKDYKMLTDDDKEEMSDKEIEKWESKIKDSLLRRDDTLGGIYNALKSVMAKGFTLDDGTQLSLASFGIKTQGYFASGENERSVFHIDGDKDDSITSGKTNLLESMIQTDPDKLSEFFSKLSNNLYSELSKKCSSIANYRSYGTFYNDKKLKTDISSYDTKIKKEEDKLEAYMDRYYKQFARMESALAKLNSSQSSLTSFFGQ